MIGVATVIIMGEAALSTEDTRLLLLEVNVGALKDCEFRRRVYNEFEISW